MTEPLRLAVINTGGTIGGRIDDQQAVRSIERSHEEIAKWANAVLVDTPFMAMSENLSPTNWRTLAANIRQIADSVDCVLVLHGTDTMAYSAAFCSFALSDLSIPIVFTGANVPYDEPPSDGPTNIERSAAFAAQAQRGVYVCFSDVNGDNTARSALVHLGTRSRKCRRRSETFITIGGPPLAEVLPDDTVRLLSPYLNYEAQLPADINLMARPRKVQLVWSYPGLDFGVLRRGIEGTDVMGIVLVMYPAATVSAVPGPYSAPEFTAWCRNCGIELVATVFEPPYIDPCHYESYAELQDAGAIIDCEILPETALAKLAWALGAVDSSLEVHALFEQDIAGEHLGRSS